MAEVKKITWLDVPEAAEYLGVNEKWVRRAIAENHIRFNKLGGRIRFNLVDLDELIEVSYREPFGLPRSPGQPGHRRRSA